MPERERRGVERETVNGRKQEFSVFVNNLPLNLDKHGLRGIFQRAGRVSDSYIPFKRPHRGKSRFGFVRFWRRNDAINSIFLLNKTIIRGKRLFVSMARPKRRNFNSWNPQRLDYSLQGLEVEAGNKRKEVWKKKEANQANVNTTTVRFSQESQPFKMGLKGQINHDFEGWLQKSLVCTSEVPRDLATLDSAIVEGFGRCSKIYALSCFKFLLVFPTVEEMEESLVNHEELKTLFYDIKKWTSCDLCDTRKVWIDVYGVPPHGWSWENFKRIAELWGDLICLAKPILRTESFEVMRVLIAAKSFHRIDHEILLYLGSEGYRIKIMEAGLTAQVAHQIFPAAHQNLNKVSSDDVPGFEDVDDEVASGNNVAQSLWGLKGQVSGEVDREEVEDSSCIRLKGTSDKGGGQSRDTNGNIIYSASRTITANFSQNGFSEEIAKVSQHLNHLGNHQKSQFVEQTNAGNEAEINTQANILESSVIRKSLEIGREQREGESLDEQYDKDAPPGFEHITISHLPTTPLSNLQDQDSETTHPPGFENLEALTPLQGHDVAVGQPKIDNRRVTRSQSRKIIAVGIRCQTGAIRTSSGDHSDARRDKPTTSIDTTESIAKMAEKALEIGNMVGLKIIDKKEVALKRIKSSLKKERVAIIKPVVT